MSVFVFVGPTGTGKGTKKLKAVTLANYMKGMGCGRKLERRRITWPKARFILHFNFQEHRIYGIGRGDVECGVWTGWVNVNNDRWRHAAVLMEIPPMHSDIDITNYGRNPAYGTKNTATGCKPCLEAKYGSWMQIIPRSHHPRERQIADDWSVPVFPAR